MNENNDMRSTINKLSFNELMGKSTISFRNTQKFYF